MTQAFLALLQPVQGIPVHSRCTGCVMAYTCLLVDSRAPLLAIGCVLQGQACVCRNPSLIEHRLHLWVTQHISRCVSVLPIWRPALGMFMAS